MKKALISIFLAFVLLSSNAGIAEAASLTPSQISAIVGLLRSFGADEGAIARVNAVLTGTSVPTDPEKPVITYCPTIKNTLYRGSSDSWTGGEVSMLQRFLRQLYPDLPVTGYFGVLTEAAVERFQSQYGISPVGIVGPETSKKIASLCGPVGYPIDPLPPVSAGYLDIEPSSASMAIGESKSFQAFYQPPMPKCPEGAYCAQVMPARFPVEAEWTSSNPSVTTVSYKEGPALQSIPIIRTYDRKTAVVSGISNGTADIKASYKSPLGTVLTVTAKVIVVGVNMPTPTNIAPKIIGIPAIPSSLQPGQSVSFSWNAMDADRDNLRWSGSWGDGIGFAGACPVSASNLTIGTNSGTNFMAFHNWSKAGIYKVQVSVTDCKGGSDTNTFNVTVSGASGTNVQYPINQ